MKQGTVTPLWWGLWVLLKVRLAWSCAATPVPSSHSCGAARKSCCTSLCGVICLETCAEGGNALGTLPLGGICKDPGML